MKIFVKAKPKSKKEKIERIPQEVSLFDGNNKKTKEQKDEAHFVIAVKEPPIRGMANKAIIKSLAEYFNTSPSMIKLIKGEISKNKVFELNC